MAPSRPVCAAARSAAADSPCLRSGSATETQVHACIGRVSEVAGTARARCLRQLAAGCWAEVLPATTAEADRALGPMLPSTARERWPFFVLRASCHAALRDQTGLPQIGVGLSIGGSRHHPCPLRLVDGGSTIDAAGAVACCVGAPLSDRQKALQNPRPLLTGGETVPARAVRARNCVLAADGPRSTQAGLGAVVATARSQWRLRGVGSGGAGQRMARTAGFWPLPRAISTIFGLTSVACIGAPLACGC